MSATELAAEGGAVASGGLLDQIIAKGKMVRESSQTAHAKDLISEFAAQVIDQGMALGTDLVATLNKRIAEIDSILSGQLNEILHNPEF
jgi:type VI secretion system protein ImpC